MSLSGLSPSSRSAASRMARSLTSPRRGALRRGRAEDSGIGPPTIPLAVYTRPKRLSDERGRGPRLKGGHRCPPFFRPRHAHRSHSERHRAAAPERRAGGRGPVLRASRSRAVAARDRPSGRRRPRAVRAGDPPPRRPAVALRARGVLARSAPPADEAGPLPPLPWPPRPRAHRHAQGGTSELHRRARGGHRRRGDGCRRQRGGLHPLRRDQQEQPAGGRMSKEIVDAVAVLEREKGIASDRLMEALEDALLSAYKKTPGAAKYARVEVDHHTGDFKVYELLVPPDLEEKLLAEVEEQQEEPEVDPETGELREPEEPEIDQETLAQYRDQIEERDVTPHDFGRIAAQTAKQVILQRIREAERDMMFNEYQDRVGELITGIVQQSDSRYTLVQLRERVEALL